MKVRLTQKGYENLDGQIGSMFFKGGLTKDNVHPRDAVRMAATMACEWEDGSAINPAQVLLDTMNVSAPVVKKIEPEAPELPAAPKAPEVPKVPKATFTEEQLAKIADEKGIAGLREIAAPLGIKSNSIQGLIAAITEIAGVKQEQKTE